MRKFTKLLMALALTIVGVQGMTAKTQLDLPGPWGDGIKDGSKYTFNGTWQGAATGVYGDWSAYDYLWVEYSGYTGKIDLKVEYDEYLGEGDWGPRYDQQSIRFSDASGIALIAIEKTKTFVNGSKDGDDLGNHHVGDIYAKHVRQFIFQDAGAASTITINGIWVGTEAEYLEAIGYNAGANHALKVNVTKGDKLWSKCIQYTLPTPLTSGKTYILEADINSVSGGDIQGCIKGDGASHYGGKSLWTNKTTKYSWEFTSGGNHTQVEFQIGLLDGELYIDNISLKEKGESDNLIDNGDFEIPLSTAGWSEGVQAEKDMGEVLAPPVLISVGADGWRSFITGSNIKMSDGIKAYTAKYMAEGNYVKLTEVTEVNPWQPVLIQATPGDYYLESPANVTPVGENDLIVTWSDVESNNDLYALANLAHGVGFYQVKKGVKVPSGKAYLKVTAGAPEFLGFDFGGTTSISELNVKSQAEGEYYNLAGQRVAQPTKGLYIVNGKKYIVK